MSLLRRAVLPVLWLIVAAAIATALVKIAFFSSEVTAPTTQPGVALVEGAVTTVERTDLSSTLRLDGTVEADAGTPQRATHSGEVVKVWRKNGDVVQKGAWILQVKAEAADETTAPSAAPGGEEDGADGPTEPVPTGPQYHWYTLLATTDGIVSGLETAQGQQLNAGDTVATLSPGTFSIIASLTPEQQLQLLDKPLKATATLPTAEKPITCQDPSIAQDSSEDRNGRSSQQQISHDEEGDPVQEPADTSRASLRCAVPEDVRIVAGLKSPITVDLGSHDDVLAVPTTAVIGEGKSAKVYVPSADGGDPTEAPVELGLRDGDRVEVVKGLKKGQEILEIAPGVSDPADTGGSW